MKQLQLPYSDVDGRFTRIFLPLLFGALAALGIWGLLHWVVQLPSATLPSVLFGLALIPGTWILSWLAIRLAVLSLRSGRGDWWLRLSSAGWEVNDRIFRPRRYAWSEIDTFMLVAPSAQIEHAVVAPGTTVAEAARNLGAQPPALRVGFRYSPGHRRPFASRLYSGLRGRDGTKADGVVMGYWDRPFDEAVDLMNEWLARHRTA